jgi:salicylate hydroxylase/6-hydroxynicotinate 3-monooxygenase
MAGERAMSGERLSVAVVGAGIGGLAVAAALRRVGVDVQVYEQAARFARVGAGIQMTPNAMRVLRGLGLEERLRRVAFSPPIALNREWDTGEVTNQVPVAAQMEARNGAPYLLMHRAELHLALASAVPPEIIHLGSKLVGIDQGTAGVTLAFADGTSTQADAAIGADGVHSVVRELLLGPESPQFSGRVAYRTTFPAALLRAKVPAAKTKWWGIDRHIVVYYITSALDELYFTTSQPERADWLTRESWSEKGDVVVLREAFAGFHPEVQSILAACPEVHKWAILSREPLPRWGEGRIVLLGDACHPMTPYMAQGAATSLEDAAVLSRCLEGIDRDGVEQAFRRYEVVRRPRTSQIQQTSSTNTWMRRETNPDWVYGYDAWSVPLDAPVSA